MNLQQTVCLLLCAWAVKAQNLDFEDKSPNDLCYICSCRAERTEVDCSRRGLRDLPDGLDEKVLTLLYKPIPLLSDNAIRILSDRISTIFL